MKESSLSIKMDVCWSCAYADVTAVLVFGMYYYLLLDVGGWSSR